MGLFICASVTCMWFLALYSGFLGGIGIGIALKGAYHLLNPPVPEPGYIINVENFNRLVLLTYILPGCIMIVVGTIGYQGAKLKQHFLFLYTAILIALMSARLKGVVFSIYAYFTRLSATSGDFGLLTGIIYPEYGIQIALLLATLYLIYISFLTNNEEDDDNGNNNMRIIVT